jgi:cytidyltransferase-like protein
MPNAAPPRVGLTLGKYAPLHRGHQLVIETALAEMDHVIVIVYDCPEVTPIALPVRAGWIRRLYPAVKVIEAWDGPREVGDTPAIQRMHERYVIDTLGIRGISHFYSSEFYGAHMSRALGAYRPASGCGAPACADLRHRDPSKPQRQPALPAPTGLRRSCCRTNVSEHQITLRRARSRKAFTRS